MKREPWAWCWCFCCARRLELYDSKVRPRDRKTATYSCCGRVWGVDQAQPRPLHEHLAVEADRLMSLGLAALMYLERWPGRKPKGLKALIKQLRPLVDTRRESERG